MPASRYKSSQEICGGVAGGLHRIVSVFCIETVVSEELTEMRGWGYDSPVEFKEEASQRARNQSNALCRMKVLAFITGDSTS